MSDVMIFNTSAFDVYLHSITHNVMELPYKIAAICFLCKILNLAPPLFSSFIMSPFPQNSNLYTS